MIQDKVEYPRRELAFARFPKSKRAVVTGASGFLGKALVSELQSHGYYVFALTSKDPYGMNLDAQSDTVEWMRCTYGDYDRIYDLIPCECGSFFHLAWAGVSGEMHFSAKVQLSNIQACIDALRSAKKIGCVCFLCTGSIHETECIEELQLHRGAYLKIPPYKIAKLTAHDFCTYLAEDLGIKLFWPLITNAYGPSENSTRLINTLVKSLMNGISPSLTSGKQLYNFIYVTDAARAIRMIAEKGNPFERYVVGTDEIKELREFLIEARDLVAYNVNLNFGKSALEPVFLKEADLYTKALRTDTGFKPQVPFREGISLTRDSYIQ